jgi:SPP1 family predicted phage head-tail adaptor
MSSARIKIYKYQYGKVDGRRVETEPILYHECWCEIGSLYGKELYRAIEIRLEDAIVFDNVRYCEKVKEIAAHLKDYFVEYEGEKYNIFARDFRQNDKQYVQLKANRVT